jgi:transcriptional regulator with XRE-family HTH domain
MSSLGNKEVMSRNLKYYIDRSGQDRKELAKIWGFPYSTVTEWINGKKYPRIDRIEIMADYFGILKSDLIEMKDEETNSPDQTILTEGEEMLLKLFRQIPVENRALVLEMIRAAVKSQE